MPRASHSATVEAPIEALWQRLADIEAWPRWLSAPYVSESVTIATPAPPSPGTELVLKGRLSYRLFARITDWQDGRLLAFEVYRSEYPSDRLFFRRAVIAIELEKVDGTRTRVTCRHQVEGKGVLGRLYMATAFRPFLAANVRRIVQDLARAVV